jgi:hypothetical protein
MTEQLTLRSTDWCESVELSYRELFGKPNWTDGLEEEGRFWIRLVHAVYELRGIWSSQGHGGYMYSGPGLMCYIHLGYDKVTFTADKRMNYHRERFLEFLQVMREPHEYRLFPKLITDDLSED